MYLRPRTKHVHVFSLRFRFTLLVGYAEKLNTDNCGIFIVHIHELSSTSTEKLSKKTFLSLSYLIVRMTFVIFRYETGVDAPEVFASLDNRDSSF